MARALRTWAINQREKTRIRNLQSRTDKTRLKSKIFIMCLRSIGCAGKETIVEVKGNLAGRTIEIRPAKLSSHTARTN